MNKTQTRDGKGQIDDVLFSMIAEQMSNQVPVEPAEQISIEDSVHPASMKMYDAARSGIKSPVILDQYNPNRPAEELSFLTIIDHYCTIFGSMKKDNVVKTIEKKLQNDEPLEDVALFAAAQFNEKTAGKANKRIIAEFKRTMQDLESKYSRLTASQKEKVRQEMPILEKLIRAKDQVSKMQEDKAKENVDGLNNLVLREFFGDMKRVSGKAGKSMARYAALSTIGLLPNKWSNYLIDKGEQRGLFDPNVWTYNDYGNKINKNSQKAFYRSLLTEIGIGLIPLIHYHSKYETVPYIIGAGALIIDVLSRFTQEDSCKRKYPGSLLFTLPILVGKGFYYGAKGVFHDFPKYINKSIDNYKESLKERAIKKYNLESYVSKDENTKKSNPI